MIDDHEADLLIGDDGLQFLDLARAQQRGRSWRRDRNRQTADNVEVNGIGDAQATASSKQDAETLAAEEFLRKFA